MPIKQIKNKYYIYKAEKAAEPKFRKELSRRIIKQFGKGPHDHSTIKEILIFCLHYYIEEFEVTCQKENSYTFYKMIFWLHEQATELSQLHPHENFSLEINRTYVAKYRRTLKYILEQGIHVKMRSGEKMDKVFKKRLERILNDLLYLGIHVIFFAESLAEQEIIEDVTDVTFTNDDLYVLSRRHHYEKVFEYMNEELSKHLKEAIIDPNGTKDFYYALESCLQIKYENVCELIGNLHNHFKVQPGEVLAVNWDSLPKNLHGMFDVPQANAETFFLGLRLDQKNKMSLLDLVRKPYNLNRSLYKPILYWNVDNKDFAILGAYSWEESIHQYITNAFPWGKGPSEWMANKCFSKYVHKKEDEHDKWLDDAIEEKLINQGLMYDRNIKHLQTTKGHISINKPQLGEIDFLIISYKTKTVFVADCKHLLGRYDINNQKNDYDKFINPNNKKSYNTTMSTKLDWVKANKGLIQVHFSKKYNDPTLSLDEFSFEGIFIINTPTLYMYSSEFRIYTVSQIEAVLLGEFKDPTFTYMIIEDDCEKTIFSKYPYFKKPKYVTFSDDQEE